jgi:hypothetical protein
MIKKYLEFIKENQSYLCKKYKIRNYTINEDGSIDVDDDVDLDGFNLTEIPIQFGKVTGSFNCSNNKLTSLEGCPTEVGDNFMCYNNKLNSLKGGPKIIHNSYSCSNNKIWTFKGVEYIKYDFYCGGNPIMSVYNLFGGIFDQVKAIETINLKYPDLFQTDGINYGISCDVLEEIADELKITLPDNYQNLLVTAGYILS